VRLGFVVLGSGTAVPSGERGPAGFLVRLGDRSWLVDGGTGTLQRCARAGVDPVTLAGGFYSHRHPDHCADLVPLLFAMKVAGYLPSGSVPVRSAPYPIAAGTGFRDHLAGLVAVFGKWIEPDAGIAVHELPLDGPGRHVDGDLVLTTRPANHTAGALHLRWDAGGRSVVFSGDTGPSEALVELATGVDLLVCECAGSDAEPAVGHLTPTQVADIAARARPRELWLTHFYPYVDPEDALATVASAGVPVRRAADLDVWR
jgi:ribonuclease BN (tRNA processing enzyme)